MPPRAGTRTRRRVRARARPTGRRTVVFVDRWGVLGLGLAFAFAYLLSAAWALTVLRDKVGAFPLRPILSSGWRMLLAAVLMAEAMWFVTRNADGDAGWSALGQIAVGGIVSIVVYLAAAFVLRIPELDQLRRRLPGVSRPGRPSQPRRSSG